MEKYIKAAAAIIGIGALGYIGYRVATKQTVVRVRTSAQSSTGPDAQPRKAEASEQRIHGGGLDAINKTHFGILWRRAGLSQNAQSVHREGTIDDGLVSARIDGRLHIVAMVDGKLNRGIQMNPGAEGADQLALIDSSSDPVDVASAISLLMTQTAG